MTRTFHTHGLFGLLSAAMLSAGCSLMGLDQVPATPCNQGNVGQAEQNARCEHLNRLSGVASTDTCQTWQCVRQAPGDTAKYCELSTRDDDGDGKPAAMCAMNRPESERDCNDDPNSSGNLNTPDGTEICDSLDNNCNGFIDDGVEFSSASSQGVAVDDVPVVYTATPNGVAALIPNSGGSAGTYRRESLTRGNSGWTSASASALGLTSASADDDSVAFANSPNGMYWFGFAAKPRAPSSGLLAVLPGAMGGGATETTFRGGYTCPPTDAGVDASVDAGSDASLDARFGDASSDAGIGEPPAPAYIRAASALATPACGNRVFFVSGVQRSEGANACASAPASFRAYRLPYAANTGHGYYVETPGPSTADAAGPQLVLDPTAPETTPRAFSFIATQTGIEVGVVEIPNSSCCMAFGTVTYTRIGEIATTAQGHDLSVAAAGSDATEQRFALGFRDGDCASGTHLTGLIVAIANADRALRTIQTANVDTETNAPARTVSTAWLQGRNEAVIVWTSVSDNVMAVRGRRIGYITGLIPGTLMFPRSTGSLGTGIGRLYFAATGNEVDGIMNVRNVPENSMGSFTRFQFSCR